MGQNLFKFHLPRNNFTSSKISRGLGARLQHSGSKAVSPLKDKKTAFSAFLHFQATFHSKSFSPQMIKTTSKHI
jgi:hypothetical protein